MEKLNLVKILGKKIAVYSLPFLFLFIGGCATVSSHHIKEDPLENLNRKIFTFNRGIDKAIIRPVAKGYDFVVPNVAQKGIAHFFSNLGEVPNIANDCFQADAQWALVDSWRLIINTTIGIVGLFDVATPLGLPKHKQDFGLTLVKWGYKNSAYLVLPILGPSTVRDTIGLPVNYLLYLPNYVEPDLDRFALQGLNIIEARARLLSADAVIDEAFDPYVLVRDAYLQKRSVNIDKNNHNDLLEEQNGTADNGDAATANNGAKNSSEANETASTSTSNSSNNETKNKTNKTNLTEPSVSYSPI